MKNRFLQERIKRKISQKHARLVVLTGARQTGKTTLARRTFPQIAYISLEDPVVRPSYTRLSAVEAFLDKPLLCSLVLSLDRDARMLCNGVLALPAAWALGSPV